MSSLFNYELDEKNIRLTLQNARHSAFSEASWNEFEENFSKNVSKQQPASFIKLPQINLNINRNVILPVFFILALVGVSAIMLSFIDFKSADEVQVEKKLEPNADNFIPTVQKSAAITVKKPETTQPKIIAPAIKKDSITTVPTQISTQNSTGLAAVSNTVVTEPKEQLNRSEPMLNQTENAVTAPSTASVATTQNAYHKVRRKKAEKVPEEQIETMKAPALIKEETETAEPELEIKID